MASNIIQIGLWGPDAPRHTISSICLCNHHTIITGSYEGHICTWEIINTSKNELGLILKYFLFSHNSEVRSLLCSSINDYYDKKFVSLSSNGEISCWNELDGSLLSTNNLPETIIKINSFFTCGEGQKMWSLIAHGYQSEILIINPLTMEITTILQTLPSSDWNYACCPILLNSQCCFLSISISGKIRIWSEIQNKTNKTSSFLTIKELTPHLDIGHLKYVVSSLLYPHMILLVSSRIWQVINVDTFEVVFMGISHAQQTWISGEFLSDNRIVMFDKHGGIYMYRLNDKNNSIESIPSTNKFSNSRIFKNFYGIYGSDEIIIQGSNESEVLIYTIGYTNKGNQSYINLSIQCSLADIWKEIKPPGIIEDSNLAFQNDGQVNDQSAISRNDIGTTCSLYLSYFGFSVFGRSDGLIIITNTSKAVSLQLLDLKDEKTWAVCLVGHTDRISALIHPFSHNQRYQSNHLISGSLDQTIRVWDLVSRSLISLFCNHSSKINYFMITLCQLSSSLNNPLISVGNDDSISMISLDNMSTCFISHHSSQIYSISWNTKKHLMIVHCFDGNLFFWNYDSGVLDFVLFGLDAKNFMENYVDDIPSTSRSNSSRHKLHMLKNTLSQSSQSNIHEIVLDNNINSFNKSNMGSSSNLNILESVVQSSFMNSKKPKLRNITKSSSTNFNSMASVEEINLKSNNILHYNDFIKKASLISDNFTSSIKDSQSTNKIGFSDSNSYNSIWHHQPLHVVPLNITKNGYEINILLFDIEMLLNLFNQDEEFKSTNSQIEQSNSSVSSQNILNYLHCDDYEIFTQALEPAITSKDYLRFISAYQKLSRKCLLFSARLLLSCLTAWDVGYDLNSICCDKLGFVKPKSNIYFGSNSFAYNYSIILPGWHPSLLPSTSSQSFTNLTTSNNKETIETINSQYMFSEEVSTNHIVFIVALANSFISFGNRISFVNENYSTISQMSSSCSSIQNRSSVSHNQATFVCSTPGFIANSNQLSLPIPDSSNILFKPSTCLSAKVQVRAQVKASWSFLAAVHCCMLNDLFQKADCSFISPSLPILIEKWQDSGVEIREASQAIILAEMRRIGPTGRIKLIEQWYPKLIKQKFEIIDYNINSNIQNENTDNLVNEFSTQNVTAVFILSIIGAEFQKELDPLLTNNSNSGSVMNSDCVRLTSQYLMRWVQRRSSSLAVALNSTRRIALELIGRGFQLWQPYIDSSQLIVSILELITRLEVILKQGTLNSKINTLSVKDLIKSARYSLNLIAQTRPATFISTLVKEIARYSVHSWSHHSHNNSFHASTPSTKSPTQSNFVDLTLANDYIKNIILFSRKDIIKTLELMIDKCPHDIYNYLVEVVDIFCHCVDHKSMKDKGLLEMFPLLSRYHMISHCNHSRRLAVGSKIGSIGIFELRNNKFHSIAAHSGPINCLAFSPDGKLLVSLSIADGKILFWQSTHSLFVGIFSINTPPSSFKCVSTYDLISNNKQHLIHQSSSSTNSQSQASSNHCQNILRRSCRFSWTDHRSVVLIHSDGTEMKFSA